MCDHCFHRKRPRPPLIDLRPHIISLCTILENAAKSDAKLTGAKLIDAWFHKGASVHRCASVPPPAIDRYFAEQIVAHLITTNYLKEDFHFTAYATISYITRGSQNAARSKNPIEFQCARILALPNASSLNASTESSNLNVTMTTATDDGSEDEVVFVSEDLSQRKKKKKKSKNSDKRSYRERPESSRREKSSEKKRKHRRTSEVDSMCLSQRMLDFQDEESTYGDVATRETLSRQVASVLEREKKRRKLIEEKNRVEMPVGENDDLLLVQRNTAVIEVIDSS